MIRAFLILILLSLQSLTVYPIDSSHPIGSSNSNVDSARSIERSQTIDRKILFTTALERFGFIVASMRYELDLDPDERKAFNDIVITSNNRIGNRAYQNKTFELQFSENENEFKLNEDETIRTAYTFNDPLSNIFINQKLISNPKVKLDFINAIQILLHEIAHKTKHSKKTYVDTLASKVESQLRTHFHTFQIEPGYSIQILGVTSPLIRDYNSLNKITADRDRAFSDLYLFSRLYSGSEITIFENHNGNATLKNSISTYIGSMRGFYNVPHDQTALETINMTQIYNIEKDSIGDRFPIIRINYVSHHQIVQVSPSGVKIPLTNPSKLAHEFTMNNLYGELAIHTNRNGIQKISTRPQRRLYLADSATLKEINYKDNKISGSGELLLAKEELEHFKQFTDAQPIKIEILLKFKGSQASIPTQLQFTEDRIQFRFSQPMQPIHDEILIDRLVLKDLTSRGDYKYYDIPLDEAQNLKFPKTESNSTRFPFEMQYWGTYDKNNNFTHFEVNPRSFPAFDRQVEIPSQINSNFNIDFLFKSSTPIHEISFALKSSDRVYDLTTNKYKFSRIYDRYIQLKSSEFYQKKIGPYYHVYLEFGLDFTPAFKAEGDDRNEIESDKNLMISRMRVVNENLEVIGTDDPITQMTLNGIPRFRNRKQRIKIKSNHESTINHSLRCEMLY